MRPARAAFIPGAAAWAKKKAALMFTAMMPFHCSSVTSSRGLPTWPEDAAGVVDQHVDMASGALASASRTKAKTASRSVTSTVRTVQRPPASRQRWRVSASSSASRSQAHTLAPRWAKASAMARPKPWAAPVTMTVLLGKVMFMAGCSPEN